MPLPTTNYPAGSLDELYQYFYGQGFGGQAPQAPVAAAPVAAAPARGQSYEELLKAYNDGWQLTPEEMSRLNQFKVEAGQKQEVQQRGIDESKYAQAVQSGLVQQGQDVQRINNQIDTNWQGAQGYLNQLPTYKNVQYQGPTEQDIQKEYDSRLQDLSAATNPYVTGTSGNIAANEIARQQSDAAQKGMLGASGNINLQAQLIQQANAQQAQLKGALSDQRFTRRQDLGTALTGLAQYNQGNEYNSQLQKALQGLSTYGSYYAAPKSDLANTQLGLGQKNTDLGLQNLLQRQLTNQGVDVSRGITNQTIGAAQQSQQAAQNYGSQQQIQQNNLARELSANQLKVSQQQRDKENSNNFGSNLFGGLLGLAGSLFG